MGGLRGMGSSVIQVENRLNEMGSKGKVGTYDEVSVQRYSSLRLHLACWELRDLIDLVVSNNLDASL